VSIHSDAGQSFENDDKNDLSRAALPERGASRHIQEDHSPQGNLPLRDAGSQKEKTPMNLHNQPDLPARGSGAAAFPEAASMVQPQTATELDSALDVLAKGKDRWATLTIPDRIAILDRTIERLRQEGPAWVEAAMKAKGIPSNAPQGGEEWLAGPVCVARNLRLLKETLQDIQRTGTPRLPAEPRQLPNGQIAVDAFPTGLFDKMLFRRFTGEIWMQPGVTRENLKEYMAAAYRNPSNEGKVALVLGAGNVSSIGPMDLLHKLFTENQVVILKMNPVNEYLAKHFEKIFKEFIDRGALRIVCGGAREGQYLCHHKLVDEIHITGSDKTHDAIVFGGGADGELRKKNRTPILEKRITSELGNVSPVIVVPGPWSRSDLAYHGENLASMLTNNAGFNCNATRVIITDGNWNQRDQLLQSVRESFDRAPLRKAYYLGAEERFAAFVKEHPDAERLGGTVKPGELPWLLVSGLDPEKKDEICFTTEAFCSVTSEVPLMADSVVDYIEKAVDFANNSVWGTLNASIIVHPESMKDPKVAAAVEKAIENLRMGSVAVNNWAALSYAFVSTTWGAFPGHDIYDIRSGVGVVHNTYLFDRPEKSVIRGPFKAYPKPAWFVSNARGHEIGRKLLEFECNPSALKLPGILWDALRG
jgi:acyl-CoA reductase-like NAD-dependent aldehyde dehydrogenase